jgi:hypothetical protein
VVPRHIQPTISTKKLMLHSPSTFSWAREAPDRPQLMPTETNLDDEKSRLNVPPRMCSKHETFEVGIEPTGADGEKKTEVVGGVDSFIPMGGACAFKPASLRVMDAS